MELKRKAMRNQGLPDQDHDTGAAPFEGATRLARCTPFAKLQTATLFST